MAEKATRAGNGDGERREFPPAPRPRSSWITLMLISLLIALFLPLGLYLYYGFAEHTFAMRIDPAGLSIRFGMTEIYIPPEDIAAVTYVAEPLRMRRIRGVGLPSLQVGWYNLEGYGRVYRLTTSGENVVYVDTRPDAVAARPGVRYVFSPEEPERFAALLESLRQGDAAAVPTPEVFRSAPGTSVFAEPIMIVALIVTLPLAVLIPYMLSKGPRTLTYAVGPDGIHVRHFRWRLYPWESVHDVVRWEKSLSRIWRVMGASVPGYYIGNFSAHPLGSAKVYATRLSPPLVLLKTRVGQVVISPADVDGFLAAVDEYRPKTG